MMQNQSADLRTFASQVLSLETDVADFVRSSISERTLARTVAGLNKELMQGDREQQLQARRALRRLGFM